MRKIIYRAKKVSESIWIYGDPITNPEDEVISHLWEYKGKPRDLVTIIPETLGQKIIAPHQKDLTLFEGDIINGQSFASPNIHGIKNAVIKWDPELLTWSVEYKWKNHAKKPHTSKEQLFRMHSIKVIGNIHDNPELFEL